MNLTFKKLIELDPETLYSDPELNITLNIHPTKKQIKSPDFRYNLSIALVHLRMIALLAAAYEKQSLVDECFSTVERLLNEFPGQHLSRKYFLEEMRFENETVNKNFQNAAGIMEGVLEKIEKRDDENALYEKMEVLFKLAGSYFEQEIFEKSMETYLEGFRLAADLLKKIPNDEEVLYTYVKNLNEFLHKFVDINGLDDHEVLDLSYELIAHFVRLEDPENIDELLFDNIEFWPELLMNMMIDEILPIDPGTLLPLVEAFIRNSFAFKEEDERFESELPSLYTSILFQSENQKRLESFLELQYKNYPAFQDNGLPDPLGLYLATAFISELENRHALDLSSQIIEIYLDGLVNAFAEVHSPILEDIITDRIDVLEKILEPLESPNLNLLNSYKKQLDAIYEKEEADPVFNQFEREIEATYNQVENITNQESIKDFNEQIGRLTDSIIQERNAEAVEPFIDLLTDLISLDNEEEVPELTESVSRRVLELAEAFPDEVTEDSYLIAYLALVNLFAEKHNLLEMNARAIYIPVEEKAEIEEFCKKALEIHKAGNYSSDPELYDMDRFFKKVLKKLRQVRTYDSGLN